MSVFPFINPKTDFAFKKIFGSPQSHNILISFLNGLLYGGKPAIKSLTILDPYQAPRIEGMKDTYLDVKATLDNDRTVIIEMQVLNVLGFKKRVLYNAAKAFSTQLEVGDDYSLLGRVIALTITDFDMFPHSDQVISRYRLKEENELTDYSDDIELVFAELPKFNKSIDELATLADKWLYFLKSANRLQTVPDSLDQEPAIQNAFEVARQSQLTLEEIEIIEKQSMYIHDSRNAVLLGVQQGIEQGIEQGVQRGIEQGIEQGRAEGARLEKLKVARALFDNLPIEDIAQVTGLSVAEIEALKAEQ